MLKVAQKSGSILLHKKVEKAIKMIYGYARVSTQRQDLADQIEKLKQENCQQIFSEKYTGTTTKRPKFDQLLKTVKAGDTICVVKLDRFARNTQEALETMQYLRDRKVTLKSLDIGVIDNSAIGNLTFQIFLAFAQFERDLIVSRTQEGKAYAKKHDPTFHEGRPRKFSKEQIQLAYELWQKGENHRLIEKKTGISIATQKRRFKELEAKQLLENQQKEQA